ncbi:MAG: RES domain-containing protein [Actinomycetota bacterium]|nr:RES domain-containing protein [Actinomycetota bacterium]
MRKRKEPLPNQLRLYRVFPWLESAAPPEPGHPRYVAAPQGHGRVDNPERYLTLYLSDDPIGAIGEAFGNHSIWTSDLLTGPPALPGSVRGLATFDAADAVVIDLDDPQALLDRSLPPSRVVTRQRAITQSWALRIFEEGTWDGVRWWSFHNPEWGSLGLWSLEKLEVVAVSALSDQVALVQQAASDMLRVWGPT